MKQIGWVILALIYFSGNVAIWVYTWVIFRESRVKKEMYNPITKKSYEMREPEIHKVKSLWRKEK
jgi:hypothetical protein